jgi:signal transduction histidine kinase
MNSLRLRLLLAVLAMVLVAAGVMGAITYRNVRAETETLFDYQLRQMALSLRDQGEIAAGQADALADEQFDFVVQIWGVDGRSIYATRHHDELPSQALLGLADVVVKGQTWRTFSVVSAERVIQVAQPVVIRERLAANAALRSVAPLLLLAPVMALLAWWLVSLMLAPLRRVAADVDRRGEQLLSPLSVDGLPQEVSPLVAAFNALLQRLAASFDTQRAFVADAAHELRSPLTALKLQLQLLQRAPEGPAREAAVQALAGGIDRAARLVEQLLALARSEPGAAALPMAEVDLTELAREALAEVLPLALAKGSTLELQAAGAAPVRGERAALLALVRNLADNAVRYATTSASTSAPPGAQVVLRVLQEGGHTLLQVDDSGPGIPPSEHERVFDRFYRRSNSDEPGTGLGLAIVQSVARQHGARVSLSEAPLGGLRVTVSFDTPPANVEA